VSAAALEAQHCDTPAGGQRRVVPRGADGDVVQHAVVAADDDERLVAHGARPLEDAIDEPRIPWTGDGRHGRGKQDDDAEKHEKKLHAAPPRGPRPQAECQARFSRAILTLPRLSEFTFSPRVHISAGKSFPYRAASRMVYNGRPWSSKAPRCSSSRTTPTRAR